MADHDVVHRWVEGDLKAWDSNEPADVRAGAASSFTEWYMEPPGE